LKTVFRFLLLLLLCCGTLYAQDNYSPGINFFAHPALAPYLSTAPEIKSRAAVLVDAETGMVLFAKNPREEIPPASLTKLMTLHLLQNAVDSGRTSLDAIVPIGEESWAQNQPPRSSLMFLAPGQTVTLKEIMLGLAVSSGNAAAVAAALYLAPSVENFAGMMTQEARRMGLRVTRFVEPSGISEFNLTTASEYAVFCREYLRLHPRSLAELHSVPEFGYPKAANVSAAQRNNPGTIVQANRNNLLRTFPGVDGLKTGYIDESGYNIVLTAQRNGTRFIAVILSAPGRPDGENIRDRDGEKLLSWAFKNFKTVRYRIGPVDQTRLWKGRERQITLIPAEDADFSYPSESDTVAFTAPVGRAGNIYQVTEFSGDLIAPLPAASPAGRLIIYDENGELHRIPLVTAKAYERGNIFRRAWDSMGLFFQKVKRRLS
jgi:D-alanyl-D-alanine carboxypeptidase (penicillin-binding protein 5/6)